MKRLLTIIILSLLCSVSTWAIGEWEIFSSNGQYRQMAQFTDRLYVVSGSSLFWADVETGEKGAITSTDGMHGSDIAFLLPSEQYLVIVYRSGLVDLMDASGRFFDIPDFQNKVIAGDRTINQAKICGHELCLACTFGAVLINIDTQEIQCSYDTPSACQLAFSFGDYLYYCTETTGLMRCHRSSNYLIGSQWENVMESPLHDAAVFVDQNGEYQCWITPQNSDVQAIDSVGSITRLNLWNNRKMYPSGPYVFCSGWGVQVIRVSDRTQSNLHESLFNSCCGYAAISDTTVFVLNKTLGIEQIALDFQPSTDGAYTLIESDLTHELNYQEWLGSKCADLEIDAAGSLIAINGDKMYSGGYTSMSVSHSIINTLTDNEWSYILEDSVVAWLRLMVDDPSTIPFDYYRGLTDVVAHPTEPDHFYVGTLGHGMYEFEDGMLIAHYDATNTPEGPVSTTDSKKYTRLTALSFDEEGNLWTGYSFSDCALVARSPEGKWTRHPLQQNNQFSNLGRIIPTRTSDGHRLIWMVQNYGYQRCSVSILYNPGGAMDASKDQSFTFHSLIDQDNNIIDLNYIYDICEDHSGNIWILTTNGPFKVEDPIATANIAGETGNGKVRRIKIPRNDGTNLADYLMVSTPCTCMAIDNYNRKWIGTNGSGLYLLSDDCVTEIEHFTMSNSMLPSDEIVSLAYDEVENKLYISTGVGLVAYHTDDLAGEPNYDNMHCFPNPVRPDYTGDVRIMGLADHSTVSVTDASGSLIMRTESMGSTVVWDLRQNNGNRVSPGIYLIHGISADSKEGRVIKVLVL